MSYGGVSESSVWDRYTVAMSYGWDSDRFKIQEFYWHNSDRCKFHQRNTRKTIQTCIQLTQQQQKNIAKQWYTMNIDYKFLRIWISSFSLSEYIVEMYLQQYDIASGGQWRPRMYFSWYTSSFILNDEVYDVIESINFSRSSANPQHFSIKCLTVWGSLEQSGQVDSIVLLLRDVDKIFISILNLRKMFRIRGLRIMWI